MDSLWCVSAQNSQKPYQQTSVAFFHACDTSTGNSILVIQDMLCTKLTVSQELACMLPTYVYCNLEHQYQQPKSQ